MLIKSADDKSKRLALLQDFHRLRMPEIAKLFLPDRGYALKIIDPHYVTSEPNRFPPVQSKSSIL